MAAFRALSPYPRTIDGPGVTAAPDLPRLRRLLLGLLAPGGSAAGLSTMDTALLAALDGLAAEHRLQPLLHHLHGEGKVPDELAANWRDAYRASRLGAMAHKAELDSVCSLLDAKGIAPVALKGAWLAWYAYPDPALRPLRDLDLLLPEDQALAAFEVLTANGYRLGRAAEMSPQDALRLEKHLTPLVSPREVVIELHHRLWEVDGRMDHAAPAESTGDPRDRAVTVEGIRYLAPSDTLAHLIIHAVYDHRLDCGPLLLWDIACLVTRERIDWNGFWEAANAGGWSKGARLVLDLTLRHDPLLVVPFPAGLAPTPEKVLDAAPDLLLQPLASRQSAGVIATARAAGPKRLLQRLAARRGAQGGSETIQRDLAAEGGFAGWAGNRLRRTVGQLADPDVRRQSGDLARLSRWLDE